MCFGMAAGGFRGGTGEQEFPLYPRGGSVGWLVGTLGVAARSESGIDAPVPFGPSS